MEYRQLVKERYSVRKFADRPVEDHTLAAILEAAGHAPSAVNKQPCRILVIRGPGMEKLKACTPYTFDAPMALAVCFHTGEAWIRPFDGCNSGVIDAAVMGAHIMLAAHDLGLGSTWVGHFNPAVFRETFSLPEDVVPVAVFPIGYPAPDAKPAHLHWKRRPLEETVVYDAF